MQLGILMPIIPRSLGKSVTLAKVEVKRKRMISSSWINSITSAMGSLLEVLKNLLEKTHVTAKSWYPFDCI